VAWPHSYLTHCWVEELLSQLLLLLSLLIMPTKLLSVLAAASFEATAS